MSKLYSCRPSEIVGIESDYERFCFDEACMAIQLRINNKEEPHFVTQYKSFSDIYKKYR